MILPEALTTLANYLTGVFENREQAIAEPIWYVHLRLWQWQVPLFLDDSITLFAEQANVMKLENPYRQRLLRIQSHPSEPGNLQVQYYALKEPDRFQGAGQRPQQLQTLTLSQINLLPGCLLNVIQKPANSGGSHFVANLAPECRCFFNYQGDRREVMLGFEANANEYLTYDKGVDPDTGRSLWGAIMGPYCYQKVSL